MKHVDYIIVGFGIAGLCFAETLRQNNKSFVVIADNNPGATSASGGVLNPTVLKRFTAAWRATEFQEKAIPFYKQIEQYLNASIISEVEIARILKSVEEQNDWMVASDKNELKTFLNPELTVSTNRYINAPFKLGMVSSGYQLKSKDLLDAYSHKLETEEKLTKSTFDYKAVVISKTKVEYKGWSTNQLVFAEGAKTIRNPYFPYQEPFSNTSVLIGNKGDYVIIKAPDLKTNAILKGGMMLIPLGDDNYKVGATYDRHVYDATPALDKREEIITKLKKMISCSFEVVDQVAGVRPTIKDRRPLIGRILQHPQIAFFNGLGTRGLSMAPLLSHWLYHQLDAKILLPEAVNINRFLKP